MTEEKKANELSFGDIEDALVNTSLDRPGCEMHDDGRLTVTAAWVHDFARNLRPTAPQQHAQVALTDDQYLAAEATVMAATGKEIGVGTIKAVWKGIMQASQQPAAAPADSRANGDAIGYVVEHDQNGGNFFKPLGGYEGMKRVYGDRCRLVYAAAPAVQVQAGNKSPDGK